MLSPINRRRLLQILPFGISSAVLSFMYVLIEKGILGNSPIYPSTGNPYHMDVFTSVSLAFTMGIIIGSVEILLLNNWFQKSTFLRKLVYKTFTYIIFLIIATLLLSAIGHSLELKTNIFDERVLGFLYNFITDLAFWSIVLYISLGLVISLFFTEVSDHIGQSVLLNFFTGKYHHPIEEDRIFMFLDMKSSTTIAEQLGHVKYFSMLKEYYADLSTPIIEHGGEIYQYVGDEVIVTWKYKEGSKSNNCLNCFYAMKAALNDQSERYQSTYGVVPTFKAGIHLGEVTTGEIGDIKRDIVFSGDVLNTTARIQGLCNQYKTDLLVSDKLISTLILGGGLKKQSLGEVELRGRNEKIGIYTIEKSESVKA